MKVVIVGGVAGGATAAARIRRLDEEAEIVVFERTGYISMQIAGCPIISAARSKRCGRVDASDAGEFLEAISCPNESTP